MSKKRNETNHSTEYLYQTKKGHYYAEIETDDGDWCCANGSTAKLALQRAREEINCDEDDDQGCEWFTEEDCKDE